MNHNIRPKKHLNKVISSWTTFAFILFFFYIIGDLLANWWHNAWWVWMILGFSLIGSISTTFRYFTVGPERQTEYTQEADQSVMIEVQNESDFSSEPEYKSNGSSDEFSIMPNFCKNCGAAIEVQSQFCASCGEEL